MNKTLITGTGLTKAYGENTVLHGIDVDIHAGDFTVIMGASGSGKSTLLHTLSGMDRLSGGQLFYQGRDITNASEKELTKLRRSEFHHYVQGASYLGDYQRLRASGLLVDAIICSPPFAGSMRFYMQNWMRLWLCGWESEDYTWADTRFLDQQQKRILMYTALSLRCVPLS